MAKILIIEDETDQAELYRMALEEAGHAVVARDDFPPGEAAVDLVVLDERLGGRSGSALIPRIRAEQPAARILVLTADPDVAETAAEKGAHRGRMKPVRLSELVRDVEALLATR